MRTLENSGFMYMTNIFGRVAPLAVDSRRRLAELIICCEQFEFAVSDFNLL